MIKNISIILLSLLVVSLFSWEIYARKLPLIWYKIVDGQHDIQLCISERTEYSVLEKFGPDSWMCRAYNKDSYVPNEIKIDFATSENRLKNLLGYPEVYRVIRFR